MEINFSAENPSSSPDAVLDHIWQEIYLPKIRTRFKSIAEEFANELKQRIESDSLHLVRNSEKYAKYKAKQGQGAVPLVATGEYVNSIQVVDNDMGASVGIAPNPLRKDPSRTMIDLATILEYGTDTIPPRPHWRVLLTEFTKKYGSFQKIIFDEFADAEREAKDIYETQIMNDISDIIGE